jgi:hypothetical protein
MAGDEMAGGNGTQILNNLELTIIYGLKGAGKVLLFYLEFQFISVFPINLIHFDRY